MIIRKIYENDEDFEEQLKNYKPTELFFNFVPQRPRQDQPLVLYVITLSAVVEKTDNTTTIIHTQTSTPARMINNQQEAEAFHLEVKKMMDEIIAKLQKTNAGTFLRNGTIQVEG